ncbi:MAG: Sec-independent protein translocase protein TatB [Phenylobacterium sp.]|nr:Sec-independent protein translocase protein TatB [Phenylobacterium sp.]
MLPEVGGLEWLVIAVIALVVIGPKDLPVMMRKLGQFTAKLRGMAAEFRSSFDEMARQSELEDLRKEVEAMRQGQFGAVGDLGGEMRSTVGEIESSLGDVGVQFQPPMSYQYDDHQTPPLQISEAPVETSEPAAKTVKRRKAATKAKTATQPVEPAPKARKPAARKPRAPSATTAAAKPASAPKPRRSRAKTVEGGA